MGTQYKHLSMEERTMIQIRLEQGGALHSELIAFCVNRARTSRPQNFELGHYPAAGSVSV